MIMVARAGTNRLRHVVCVWLVLAASTSATGRAAPPDVESPEIVTCRLFVALCSTNPTSYREYLSWLEGLAKGSASARQSGFDSAAAMDRVIANCRAHPGRLFSAAALEQVAGKAR